MMRKYPKMKLTWRQWLYYKLYRRPLQKIAYSFYRYIYLPKGHPCFENSGAYTNAKWDLQRGQAEKLCKSLGIGYPDCGFYIGDGWYPAVADALKKIGRLGIKWKLGQVKQKFCTLRIYIDYLDEGIWDIDHPNHDLYAQSQHFIAEAEEACNRICETCGVLHELEVPRSGTALCRPCRKKRDLK